MSGEKPLPRVYLVNLLALLTAGVAVLGWIIYYTDWFPAVAGVLALSGVLSWIGVFLKLLPEDRVKQFQTIFDERVLSDRRTARIVVAILAAQAIVWMCVATLEVRSLGSNEELAVYTGDPAAATGAPRAYVSGAKPVRLLFVHFPFSAHEVEVRVQGRPSRRFWVRGSGRTSATYPDSFSRPALLLRPSVDRATSISGSGANVELSWTIHGVRTSTVVRTFGHSIWIGCGDDVALPEALTGAWASLGAPRPIQTRWRRPRSLPKLEALRLESLDALMYRWLNRDGQPFTEFETPRPLPLPSSAGAWEDGAFVEEAELE